MWKKLTIAAGVLLLLIALVVITAVRQKSNSRRALEAYIEELRAQGEAVSWEDLGYPPPAETNTSLSSFLAAVNKLGNARPSPGELDHMHFVAPGTAEIGWAAAHPLRSSSSRLGTNAPTWEQLIADVNAASNTLAELRASLQDPPLYFPMNLTNPLAAMPKNPFVEKRKGAQWLAADSLAALHEDDLARAQADLHSLTHMVQLHREDSTLVNTMIRVAISGLGLSTSWEALSAKGWTGQSLAQLQSDWEVIDLVAALERGMVGERIMVSQVFESAKSDPQYLGSIMPVTGGGVLGRASGYFTERYWRNHMDEDFLLYLRQMQDRIEATRQLQTNAPGQTVAALLHDQQKALDGSLNGLMNRYRYLFTAIALPNYTRACQTMIRTETQRRMTITAIALERCRLRNGHFPASLDALVPEFVSSVPIDPMSGMPFLYQTHADGTFTLYSVGEDGQDDGGDAMATNTVKSFDLWSGRDAVWPKALTNEPASRH